MRGQPNKPMDRTKPLRLGCGSDSSGEYKGTEKSGMSFGQEMGRIFVDLVEAWIQ